jgi:hypothetical protein
MANITGTNGNNVLTGTAANDTIQGLGGNDRIIGSLGTDTIDGGAGNNDVIDYSAEIGAIYLNLDPNQYTVKKFFGDYGNDVITNIEKVIGNENDTINGTLYRANNTIESRYLPNGTNLNVDLSKGQLKYSSASGNKALDFKNFDSVFGAPGNNHLVGNDFDNFIYTGLNYDYLSGTTYDYKNVIVGSKGNDFLSGQNSKNDTIDYSNLGHAETIQIATYLTGAPGNPAFSQVLINIDKGSFGKDKTIGIFDKIIGAVNQENSIDATKELYTNGIKNVLGSLDVNLANNSLKINFNIPNINGVSGIRQIEILNFVDVIGSKNDDKIVGANKKGKLTGGGGNDTVTGGNKNDQITGSDSTARGVGEVDTLTGGGGRDKFILGDASGAYYVGKGKDDYALITDFNLFQDSINLGGFKNYSFASGGNNTIDLYSGKDVNTRDLIAKIQIAGGISTNNANSRSIAGSSPNLDSIIGKIDIVSEPNA